MLELLLAWLLLGVAPVMSPLSITKPKSANSMCTSYRVWLVVGPSRELLVIGNFLDEFLGVDVCDLNFLVPRDLLGLVFV